MITVLGCFLKQGKYFKSDLAKSCQVVAPQQLEAHISIMKEGERGNE
jgi:hypothetical protein